MMNEPEYERCSFIIPPSLAQNCIRTSKLIVNREIVGSLSIDPVLFTPTALTLVNKMSHHCVTIQSCRRAARKQKLGSLVEEK